MSTPDTQELREYHVLFNEPRGPVRSETIYAASFNDCERDIQRRYPKAVYWEIGVEDDEAKGLIKELFKQ